MSERRLAPYELPTGAGLIREPLLRFSVARYSGDPADLLETNRILLGQLFDRRDVVIEGAEIERSTAADGAQINHIGDQIGRSTVGRNPAHLPGLRAPAGDASVRRRRRASRGELSAPPSTDPSAPPPTMATGRRSSITGARCSPPSNRGAGQRPAADLGPLLVAAAVSPARGRCALHPDQLAAQGQAPAMMQPVDRGLGTAHAVGDLSRG